MEVTIIPWGEDNNTGESDADCFFKYWIMNTHQKSKLSMNSTSGGSVSSSWCSLVQKSCSVEITQVQLHHNNKSVCSFYLIQDKIPYVHQSSDLLIHQICGCSLAEIANEKILTWQPEKDVWWMQLYNW